MQMTKIWYTPTKIKTSRITREDNRRNKSVARGEPTKRYKIKIKPRNPKVLYRAKYHSEITVNGVRLKVVTRYQLASFLGVRYATVQAWYNRGIFGEPIYTDTDHHGRERQYWLVKQMMCFIVVLNDILRAGYLSIPWDRFPEQVESIHKGFDHYADLAFKRLANVAKTSDDKKDKFGVEFID